MPVAKCMRRMGPIPPPPPPPPPPTPDTPRKSHNPQATAAAIHAADTIRQQRGALAKNVVYAPHEASVATKVTSLLQCTALTEMGAGILIAS